MAILVILEQKAKGKNTKKRGKYAEKSPSKG